jgi:hypothetical protein
MRIDDSLHGRFKAVQIICAVLQLLKGRLARFQIKMKDVAQALKGSSKGLMKRPLSVDAMDDIYGSGSHSLLKSF